jgi:uncharacterized protein YeaO (DUF488 family)
VIIKGKPTDIPHDALVKKKKRREELHYNMFMKKLEAEFEGTDNIEMKHLLDSARKLTLMKR